MSNRSVEERLRTTRQIIRLRHGDGEAFAELVGDWEQPLLFYLRRLLSSEEDSWDALQETWIKVLRKIHTLKDPDALPAWLYRIARNTGMSRLRKLSHEVQLPESDILEDIPAPQAPDPVFAEEEVAALHEAIDRLPPIHREAVVLHFLNDLSIAEIASLLAIPPGTVKTRVYHAKRKLIQLISESRRPGE